MEKTPNPASIKTLAVYTAYPWDHAIVELRLAGPARLTGVEILRGSRGAETDIEIIQDADLVIIQRDFPRDMAAYRDVLERARLLGKPIVFDMDDLLLELPPDHPDRAIHYYTSALIPMLGAIVQADAITASTERLGAYLRDYNSNVWVLPNYLDDTCWKLRPTNWQKEHQPLVIGYIGGNTHLPDLEAVLPVLASLAQKHSEALRLRFWGGAPPSALQALPNVDWTDLGLPYPEFADYAFQLECDIFIAPLQDNLFNHCKSAVKYLEYSALGVPGVYSRVEAFENVVQDGVNGLLAGSLEEWENHLNQLIESPDLRARIGRAAQETVRRDWLLSEHAGRWREVYSKIIEGYSQDRQTGASGLSRRVAEKMTQLYTEVQAMQREKEEFLLARTSQAENDLQSLQTGVAWKLGTLLAPPHSRRERLVRRIAAIRR